MVYFLFSIYNECKYCGRLYTFVSNKEAHGGRGTIIAIIAGVKAETVLRWLLEIPEKERMDILFEEFPELHGISNLPFFFYRVYKIYG